jgi:rod shape-determining protein MreB
MFSFDSELYIQIWPTKLAITKVKTGEVFKEDCIIAVRDDKGGETEVLAVGSAVSKVTEQHKLVAPFEPGRLLVNDFDAAERLITHCVKTVYSKSFIQPSPRLVIHPMQLPPDGISSIELRAFRELGVSAGAREVKVYIGPGIQMCNFDYNSITSADELAGSAIQKTSTVIVEAIVSVTVLLIFMWLFNAFIN